MPKLANCVLLFHPESMGEVERFITFYSGTYSLPERDRRAVNGLKSHMFKAVRLINLAQRLVPNLDIDEAELEVHGATPADNASELATVVEACVLEIYSALDCAVKTLFAIYNPIASDKKKSTRRFFSSFDPLVTKMPVEVAATLSDVGWYKRLLHLRDELTHLDAGAVHRDRDTRKVRYIHHGITEAGKPLVIEDIFGWLDATMRAADGWLARVFLFLNGTLSDAELVIPCGIHEGKFLMRRVSGKPPVTFNSGRCMSAQWFDQPSATRCPFADQCGAYRPVPGSAP